MRVITIARKPLGGSVAACAIEHGTGSLNIDGCRVGVSGGTSRSGQAEYPRNSDGTEDRSQCWARTGHSIVKVNSGRWPTNLILEHFPGCQRRRAVGEWVCEEGCPVQTLDQQSGISKSVLRPPTGRDDRGISGYTIRRKDTDLRGHEDNGGASRFFKQVKP